ncbi:MAG: SHOCT domain-containing protein [Nitrosopumilus sp.]|nr:SHOCT domain-containing protein [Nitrosopumilus sp.]
MELKSEKSIKEYLKTLSDDVIIKYYLDVEFSPFPILVIEEYTRRFKRKTKDEIIKDLKTHAHFAKKKTREFGKMAKKHHFIDDVTREKSEEIFNHAKKKGYEISEKISLKGSVLGLKLKKKTESGIKSGIQMGKNLKSPSNKDLDLLKKLGDLRKAGVITNKEFLEKKKKILSKI